MSWSRAEGGFTLVELLVALSLVGLVLALVGSIFMWGNRHVGRTVDTFDMETDGYAVLREITSGFVDVGAGRQIGLIAAEKLRFSADAGVKRLEYTWESNGQPAKLVYVWDPNGGTLTREIDDLGAVVLLRHVTEFRLCLNGFGLEVALSQRNSEAPLSAANAATRVYPRNAPSAQIDVPSCA